MDEIAEFWLWFQAHEDRLLHFEQDQENIFDELLDALHKVEEGLTFEFGPPDERRDFVVSADGIKDHFPAVVALTKAAPELPRWRVIAFRPRRYPISGIGMAGLMVQPEEVQFCLASDGAKAGIYLFLPDSVPDGGRQQMGYLFLDEALGEFDVETRLGMIEIEPQSSDVGWKRSKLEELPGQFDALVARIEGRSGKAS